MNRIRNQARGLQTCVLGFSLIETVIAIAIIAVTFIGIIGLLGLGLANNQTSTEQTVAANIAASIVADLRSTPSYSTTSPRYSLALPTSVTVTPTTPLSGVTPVPLYFNNDQTTWSSTSSPGATYVANVYLSEVLSSGPTPAEIMYVARVVVSWPAATTTVPVGSVDVITQFRVN